MTQSKDIDRFIDFTERMTEQSLKRDIEINGKIEKLTEAITKLAEVQAVRAERDKNQDQFNKRIGKRVDEMEPTVNRLKLNYQTTDKVKVPLIVGFILAILSALGFSFTD